VVSDPPQKYKKNGYWIIIVEAQNFVSLYEIIKMQSIGSLRM